MRLVAGCDGRSVSDLSIVQVVGDYGALCGVASVSPGSPPVLAVGVVESPFIVRIHLVAWR